MASRSAPAPAAHLSSQARWVLVGCALVTLALFEVRALAPIARPLVYLSTMVHEMGHGVAALISGGEWRRFDMFFDGSGVAQAFGTSDLTEAFICAGGLCGPAVIGALFMVLGLRPRLARYALGATGAFLAIALLLWVRGAFGIVFVTAVAVTCLGIALRATAETAQIALVFLATQLALSVYAGGGYLFTATATGEMTDGKTTPSDVGIMADSLGGPYWMWGLVCAGFSAAVLIGAGWLYLRAPKPSPQPAKFATTRP